MTEGSQNQSNQRSVWIAGASGFCGRGITQRLAELNGLDHSTSPRYQVLPHIRPHSSRAPKLLKEWTQLGLSPVSEEWASIESSLQRYQPQVVISCLGTTKRHEKREGGNYEEVDYGLNRQLIEIAERLETPPHFIYLSSMGVEWGRWSQYLEARMKVERDLKESRLPHSIIRPAILSGTSRDERRPLEEFGAWFSHRLSDLFTTLKMTDLAHKVKPLDAHEMAEFMLSIIEDDTLLSNQGGRTYTIEMIHQTLSRRTSRLP